MAVPEVRIPADRFAEYIGELREFSGTHRVASGKLEDLAQLQEALRNSEAFAADFCSSIRSIFLRERCQASESQLFTLVMVAWGGEQADGPAHQLPALVKQVGKMLRATLASGSGLPSSLRAEGSESLPDSSLEFDDTIRQIEETSPDVQLYRQLIKIQDTKETRAPRDIVPVQREASVPSREASSSGPQDAGEAVPILPLEQGRTKPIPRFRPSGAEVLALGLVGLAVTLLLNLGSLPIYRTRVSVYLPSAAGSATNANDGGTASDGLASSAPIASLLNGGLTEEASEQLLALPDQNPILRQDVLSRGMRDLNLGGSEPILYADLVAETARQVRVRQLQSNNLYEITCDSWSPRLATAFCNELIEVLDQQMGGAMSAASGIDSARVVDAARGPGVQVYPRWYLEGLAGLAVGCLAGIAVGLVRRPETIGGMTDSGRV